VLQTVDLTSGAGLADLAAAQAAAEGVLGFEETIVELVRAAIGSPSVEAACAGEYWREAYVAVPVEELTLEGYVDLVFRDAGRGDALVVVDYKTDAIRSEPTSRAGSRTIECRAPHTRLQWERRRVSASTGVSSSSWHRCRCAMVVIGGDELVAAIEEVRGLIRSVRDAPPPLGPLVLADA